MNKIVFQALCLLGAFACAAAPDISASKYDPLMAEKSSVLDTQGETSE